MRSSDELSYLLDKDPAVLKLSSSLEKYLASVATAEALLLTRNNLNPDDCGHGGGGSRIPNKEGAHSTSP